jgi:hypothetical protein
MTRAACFMPRKTPRSSTASVPSHASALVCAIGPTAPATPALFTITSSRPNSETARSTARAMQSSLLTFQCAKRAPSPSCAASAAWFVLQVGEHDARAVSAPIPEAAPVTTATRPWSFSGTTRLR